MDGEEIFRVKKAHVDARRVVLGPEIMSDYQGRPLGPWAQFLE